ncbi:MAG: radical SAM protein [Gammaproteobacteria bacterium]|nr:radical SAM protein [Gammaproteobacteria bacterium]
MNTTLNPDSQRRFFTVGTGSIPKQKDFAKDREMEFVDSRDGKKKNVKIINLSINKLLHYVNRHYRSLVPFISLIKFINIVVALLEFMLRKSSCISKPFVFRIDPCTACNLRCPNCEAHAVKTNEKRLLDFEDFKSIIKKIKKYCIRVSLYDTGEPLMNKSIFRMIRYLSDNKISSLISTNLMLFNKNKHLQALSNSKLTVLAPSIDGITQETYSKYRIGGNVSSLRESLEAIIEQKNRKGDKWPFVDAQIIRFNHLVEEKHDIENYLNSINVDQITWKADSWGFNPIERDYDVKKSNKGVCFWLYTGPMIRPDGNVYPCCGRGFGRFSYGNIYKNEISDIWNNDYYRFSRKLYQRGPDLEYDAGMKSLPCHECTLFKKQRRMLPKSMYTHGVLSA